MFHNRFMMIMQIFSLVDNTSVLPEDNPNYDKHFKLDGIHITLNKLFGDIYQPTRSLSIDKQMLRTKSKFGIKVWALCQSDTGSCLQFDIYTGKAEGGNVEHGLRVAMNFLNCT